MRHPFACSCESTKRSSRGLSLYHLVTTWSPSLAETAYVRQCGASVALTALTQVVFVRVEADGRLEVLYTFTDRSGDSTDPVS